MERTLKFEIKKHLGVIREYPTGWKKELNLVVWDGNPVKFDCRDWDPEHEHMSRGITMTGEEMARLMDIVSENAHEISEVFARNEN